MVGPNPQTLAAALTQAGVKPPSWAVDPDLTKHPALWDGCSFFSPLWNGKLHARDLVSGKFSYANNGGSWAITPQGRAYTIGADGDGFLFGDFSGEAGALEDAWTVAIEITLSGSYANFDRIVEWSTTSSASDRWNVYHSGGNLVWWSNRGASSDRTLGSWPGSGFHTIVIYKEAGADTIYAEVDGVANGSDTETYSSFAGLTGRRIGIADAYDGINNVAKGDYHSFAVWNKRALGPSERQQLVRSRCAMLRPDPIKVLAQFTTANPAVAPAGSGAQTLPALGQSATAGHEAQATAAQALPPLTQAGAAVEEIPSAGAQALPSLGQAGVGGHEALATAAQALPALTQAGDATHTVIGIYQPNGVDFDGTNDYLTRGAGLTGAADGKLVTIAGWFKYTTGGASTQFFLSSANARLAIGITTGGNLTIFALNAAGTQILSAFKATAFPADTWTHLAFSADLTDTGKRHLYLDDADASPTWNTYTNDDIDFTDTDWSIGGKPAGGNKYKGCAADIWIGPGQYVDFSIEANRRKFVGLSALASVDLGSDGSTPTSTAPLMYFSGVTSTWHTNDGSGGGFTENGALTDCATDPPSDAPIGVGAQVLPALTQSADAASAQEPAGAGAQTLPATTQQSSAVLEIPGSAAIVLPSLQQSALGGHEIIGSSADQILPALKQLGLGPGVSVGGVKGEGFRQNVGKMMR